jgi:CubicO group peptidase (beta-lactamase class C family)
MGKWLIALLAASVGLVAAAASAHVVVAKTAYDAHRLKGHATTAFSVSCPRGFVAVSGGIAGPAGGARLLGLTPRDMRAFGFRFANPGAAARVKVAVACRRSSGPELRLTRLERRLAVPAAGFASAVLRCPRQTTPAGSGVDLRGAGVTLRRVTANLRGFSFTVHNGAGKPATAQLYGNCLTAVRPAGAAAEPLRVEITSFTDLVSPGARALRHACRRGWLSLGTGYALRGPDVDVRAAAAVGAGGRWRVSNGSADAATVVLQLVCARLG